MGIATQVAKEIGGGAGIFATKTVDIKDDYGTVVKSYTAEVAVVYGDGDYDRFATLGNRAQFQQIRVKIRGVNYEHVEFLADTVRKTMTEKGYIPLSGIIGLEDIVLEDGSNKKQIALDYKVLTPFI